MVRTELTEKFGTVGFAQLVKFPSDRAHPAIRLLAPQGRAQMKKAFTAAVLPVLLALAAVAAPASASEATEVSAVPVVDPLNRTESPLSNSGKWTALNWS